jgi:FSR family fosmidomycin resistance protein-like MFS transporter
MAIFNAKKNAATNSALRTATLRTIPFTLAHTFNDMYPNLYPVLLPVLMLQIHFSTAAAALISTVSALTAQLLQPLMGFWADRAGGRGFVVGGLLLGSIVSAGAFAWAPSYQILLVALFIGGLGNAAFHPHASALVGELTGRRKGLGMSLFMIGGNFGRALAPVLASTIFLWGGRRELVLAALPGVIMAVVMYWFMNPSPAPKPRPEHIFTPEFKAGLHRASRLLIVVGLRAVVTLSTLTLIPILWKTQGRSIAETASLLSVIFIAASFGNLAGGTLSDITGPKPVIIASSVFSSLFLFLLLKTKIVFLSLIVAALLGVSLYSTGAVITVYSQSLFPENKGMASGLTLGLGNTLGSLGVAIIGLIADRYSPGTGIQVAACISLLVVPIVMGLEIKQSREMKNVL